MRHTPLDTARIVWLCRCVQRLKRMQCKGTTWPNGQPLGWAEYTRLAQHLLAEHRAD